MIEATAAELAFARDVPEHLQEAVMTMIAEAAQSERYESEQVSILTRDRIDAINVQAEGSVIVEGTEYYFVVEDGNNNGTVLRGWNDVGEKFELHQPTQWALQPQRHIIDDAIEKGGGQFLIAKWDALERETSTAFAAMQIAKASGMPISPARFYDSDEVAMKDIIAMAEREKVKGEK